MIRHTTVRTLRLLALAVATALTGLAQPVQGLG